MKMELTPIDPGDFTALHLHLGLALWACQRFEDTLAHCITLLLKLPPSRAIAEMLVVLEKQQSKTLGSLIAELKKANSTSSVSEFEQRMNRFLQERNWLVHESWRENSKVLFKPADLPPLLKRLEDIDAEAQALNAYCVKQTQAWARQQGIPPQELNEGHFERMRDWGVVREAR